MKMFEIYKISTGRVVLSGLSLREAHSLRMVQPDLADLAIRQMA